MECLVIRDASADDVVSIQNLLKPYVEKRILLYRSRKEILENIDKTIVYEEDGVLRGTTSLVFFSVKLCEIRALVIDETQQGKGLGKKLVLAAEEKALRLTKERPIHFFALTYTPKFFEQCGYAQTLKENFPEKIYEVCNFCFRKDDCHEIAVEKFSGND